MTDHDKGWIDDGHTLAPFVNLEEISAEIICPGPAKCQARFGCENCEGRGYVYDEENEEHPCPECDESGRSKTDTGCWLAKGMLDLGFISEFCVNSEKVSITAGQPIVWRDYGQYDDPQPQWKTKGAESYDDKQKRRREEYLAERARRADTPT